jgi:cytochrome P450 family 12
MSHTFKFLANLSFKFLGKFYNLPLIDFYKKIRSEYGDIVKFPGILGQPEILMSYDPNDFEKIFRTDGSMPIRRGLQTLGYYRKEIRPDVFKGVAGLATE